MPNRVTYAKLPRPLDAVACGLCERLGVDAYVLVMDQHQQEALRIPAHQACYDLLTEAILDAFRGELTRRATGFVLDNGRQLLDRFKGGRP